MWCTHSWGKASKEGEDYWGLGVRIGAIIWAVQLAVFFERVSREGIIEDWGGVGGGVF